VVRYSVIDAISLRLPFGEMVVEAWTLLKVTATPALLMAIPFGAMVTVQTSGLVNQVGASSLVGAASGVGVIRQGAPITAGLLMGGAAAAAIASDLGARAIREELDGLARAGYRPRPPSRRSSLLGADHHRADPVRDHHRRRGGRLVHPFRDGQRREQWRFWMSFGGFAK